MFPRKLNTVAVLVLIAVTSAVVCQRPFALRAAEDDDKPGASASAEAPMPAGAFARLGTTRYRHSQVIAALAFSPDGKHVATGTFSSGIRLWDVATGKEVRSLTPDTGAPALAFSPDGKTLACGGFQGVRLWEAGTGKLTKTIQAPGRGEVTCLAYSRDGKFLAVGGKDGVVRILDEAGADKHTLQGHQGEVRAVAFSPDGKWVASAGVDKTVRLWDAQAGKEQRVFAGHTAQARAVAFSPDGTKLASGSWDRTARLWDVETGKPLRSFTHVGGLEGVAFSPDGKSLATAGGSDGTIYCWDLTADKEVTRWKGRHPHSMCLAFSADGTKLAAGGWDNVLRIWDAATGKEEGAAGAPGHQGWVYGLCFLPDHKTLVSSGSDGFLLFWDLAAGREARRVEAHQGRVWCLALSPDGKTLASGGGDHTIRLWDLATDQPTLKLQAAGAVKGLAFSPDGTRLASACGDDQYPSWAGTSPAEACVWEVATGKKLLTLHGHQGGVKGIDFSPDGKLLATAGNDKTVRLWDAVTGKELRRLEDHHGAVEVVAFSPDGRLLASAGQDGNVRLWKVAGGDKVRVFDGPGQWVMRLDFSPDGHTLATTTYNARAERYSVRLWEVATGKERGSFAGHQATGHAVAFAPDGRALASGGADSVVLLWDLTGRMQNGQLAGATLADKELQAAWLDLTREDGVRAHKAVWTLTAASKQALPLLRGALKPAQAADAKRLAELIKDLDSDEFAVRDKASMELEKLGDQAEAALNKALAETASIEVQARVMRLLDKLSATSGERLRRQRGLEVLEHIGTAEAREVLEALAKGDPEATLTEEARAAVKRLDKQRTP
jgi:WD40 repeat protein